MNTTMRLKTKDMTYIAIGAVLMSICSWISIPTVVPFTLQTFAVFCTLRILGGKNGTISVLIYIALGLIGLPVFSNFSGGIGVLLGTTGGYIIGFIFSALIYWVLTSWLGKKLWVVIPAMVLGLLGCYAFGTLWFLYVYGQNTGVIGLATALSWCVIPFIIPDMLKIGLALIISKRVSAYIK